MGRIRASKRFDVLLHASKNGGYGMSERNGMNYIEILLVEDNQGDVVLTKRALKSGKVLHNLHVANDGEAALAFLHDVEYGQAPRPDLILLDLNLPKVNGREVLAKIKSNEALASIPVIVLTTSKADEDIMKTYELHANSFITKPVDWPQFVNVIRSIEEYWFTVVKLPLHEG
jgi:chemotaxis family two-component system response regulator Rcp1